MSEIKKKRHFRLNARHRWTTEETKILIQHVLNAIENDFVKFERPTAQAFYNTHCQDDLCADIDWITMRHKMRYLKDLYIKAKNWSDQVGSELFKSDKSHIEARINTICPFYNELDTIFGPLLPVDPIKINSNPINEIVIKNESDMNVESTECDDDNDNDIDNDDDINYDDEEYCYEDSNGRIPSNIKINNSFPTKSNRTQSLVNSTPRKTHKQNNFENNIEKQNNKDEEEIIFKLKYDLERSKLSFERNKLNLDQKYHDDSMNLKRLQFNLDKEKFEFDKRKIAEDQRLRKYEIDKQFEIKKLELEKDERIQQLELEMKYKYKNIEELNGGKDYI